MDEALDKALVKDFPLLFRDRNASIMASCMPWGFSCSQGWEPIIREAAEKLEPLIKQFIKDNPNLYCRVCGCPKDAHFACATHHPKQCLAVHKRGTKNIHFGIKYKPSKIRRFFSKIVRKINSFINDVLGIFFYKLTTCWCQEYEGSYPCASQVKEKYGTLRLYMTSETDEMSEIISEAERKSAITCEACGEPGELRNVGWYFTYCDKHHEMAKNGWKIYQDEEDFISAAKEKTTDEQVKEWTEEYTEEEK